MNKLLVFGVSVYAAVMVAPALAKSVERKIDCSKIADIHVINAVGTVDVIGTDAETCQIDAELGDQVQRLDVKERGDRMTIEVIYSGRKWRDNGTRLEVEVPHGSNIKVNGTSSDITIDDVNGVLSLQTVSGDIEVETSAKSIWASTTSGDVEIIGALQAGRAELSSTSGDVEASRLAGTLTASAVSGGIEVTDSKLQTLNLTVVSGHIELDDALTADAELEAEAVSGSVEINIPSTFAGRVNVSTLNGSIKNCFGPKAERTSRYGPGRTLAFDRGEGKGRLNIGTVNGSVKLCLD